MTTELLNFTEVPHPSSVWMPDADELLPKGGKIFSKRFIAQLANGEWRVLDIAFAGLRESRHSSALELTAWSDYYSAKSPYVNVADDSTYDSELGFGRPLSTFGGIFSAKEANRLIELFLDGFSIPPTADEDISIGLFKASW